ncbi:MAG: TonB-dependent receptor [Deltaproteobacteria bacterium]|nr:TonB-dependent receptor [Deltaproteobacteria bacterium]
MTRVKQSHGSVFGWVGGVVIASAAACFAESSAPSLEVRLEPIVVTATRSDLSQEQAPASATVLDHDAVQTSADITIDDILRTIPGFSLYRRSSSLVTPPGLDTEAQGVTLRNIGPAGASRALVMVDGVPIISPFDGQVFWGKVPQESIDHIEVVRGSGASLWGNYAMAGVINIITRKPSETGAALKASYGTNGLTDDYLSLSGRKDKLTIGLEGNFFNLDGFPVVAHDERGPIDKDASSRSEVFNGRVSYRFSDTASVALHGQYFDQAYNYGTHLRTVGAGAGLIDLSGTLHTDDGSEWQAMVFSNLQSFHINFSEANEARTSESLALKQTVPSTDLGASLVWSRRMLEPLLISSGVDLHWIDGQSRDHSFDPDTGMSTGQRRSDGKQFFAGFFLQGIYTPMPRLEIALSGRADLWTNYEGTQNGTQTDDMGVTTAINSRFQSQTRAAFNPRLSVLYRASDWLHLRAAAYRAFRAPTLAELYRQSQVEDLKLLANPKLSPERLNGAEAGVDLPVLENVDLRATGFWNEVDNPIESVDTAFDAMGNATERKRSNQGLARTFGAEVEAIYEPLPDLLLSASYLLADGTLVHTAPADKHLEGFQLAQIPPHAATVAIEYRNPKIITARLEGRFIDDQFEDQEHMDKQGSYYILNATLARQLPFWNGEVFLAGENLLDHEYTVDHGGGIKQIGSPLLVHGGLRFHF